MSEFIGSLLKNSEENTKTTSDVGGIGEKAVIDYLRRHGFTIVAANFKVPIGRNRKGVQVTGEIDIIAREKNTLCFIEVKTRSREDFAPALSAVDIRKQRQITRTARVYRKTFGLTKHRFRYDVASVVLNGKKAPTIKLIRGFWNEDKFKKRMWMDEFRR